MKKKKYIKPAAVVLRLPKMLDTATVSTTSYNQEYDIDAKGGTIYWDDEEDEEEEEE